jgi:hypothetical protein
MRTFVVVMVYLLGLAGSARADDPAMARWVGTWSGKASLDGCGKVKRKPVTLDVVMTSSLGLHTDGGALLDGVGSLDWNLGADALSASASGVLVSLRPAKSGATLFYAREDGCVIRASLTQDSSGIASCDRLRGLATLENQCTMLPAADREAGQSSLAGWSKWKKLSAKAKKAQAEACETEGDTIAASLLRCVGGSTGLVECDRYTHLMDAYMSCDKVPQSARDAAKQGLDAMKSAWANAGSYPDEVKKAANDACMQASDALAQGADAMGCRL